MFVFMDQHSTTLMDALAAVTIVAEEETEVLHVHTEGGQSTKEGDGDGLHSLSSSSCALECPSLNTTASGRMGDSIAYDQALPKQLPCRHYRFL